MSDEITQVTQIVRLGFDGMRFGMQVGGATAKQVKNIALLIYAMLQREKLQGRTSLQKMLKKDGNMQVLKIKEEDFKKFKKLAKKYGILYSKLPDLNKNDGMMEIMFHTEATPRINALIEKLGAGDIESLIDYINNGTPEEFAKMEDYLKEQNLISETPSEISSERKGELVEYAKNMKYNNLSINPDKIDITISRKLYIEENITSIKTRIPGTYGEKVRYLWIPKEDIISINNGKTFYAYLDKEKEYEIFDRDDNVVSKTKGMELQKNYDQVSDSVRHRTMEQERRHKREDERRRARSNNERKNEKVRNERLKRDAKKKQAIRQRQIQQKSNSGRKR